MLPQCSKLWEHPLSVKTPVISRDKLLCNGVPGGNHNNPFSSSIFPVVPVGGNEFMGWITHNSPRLLTTFENNIAQNLIMFGLNALIVNSSNQVYQSVYTQPVTTLTWSFHARKVPASGYPAGTPRVVIEYFNSSNNKISETSMSFSQPISETTFYRFSMTRTTPANTHYARIRLLTTGSNWVAVDGVQCVEGPVATPYQPDDELVSLIRGVTEAHLLNTRGLLVGGQGLHSTGGVYSDGAISTSSNLYADGAFNTTTGSSANVFISSGAQFARSVSAKKYKDFIKPVDLSNGYADRILSLIPKSWYDKGEIERNDGSIDGLNRYYGLIAEDLVNAGLSEYVIYNEGEVEGIAYDRVLTLLIPLVDDLFDRIKKLEELK